MKTDYNKTDEASNKIVAPNIFNNYIKSIYNNSDQCYPSPKTKQNIGAPFSL